MLMCKNFLSLKDLQFFSKYIFILFYFITLRIDLNTDCVLIECSPFLLCCTVARPAVPASQPLKTAARQQSWAMCPALQDLCNFVVTQRHSLSSRSLRMQGWKSSRRRGTHKIVDLWSNSHLLLIPRLITGAKFVRSCFVEIVENLCRPLLLMYLILHAVSNLTDNHREV